MTNRFRAWCFTLHKYSEKDWVHFQSIECEYLVMGKERGKSGNTPHIQGYIYFRNPRTIKGAKAQFQNKTIHLECARGNAKQNEIYCTKEGIESFEKGRRPSQGERTDLEEISAILKKGGTIADVIEARPEGFIRYHKGIESMFEQLSPWRRIEPKVYWLYGGTGTGKTRLATYGTDNYYIKDGTIWWDGYHTLDRIIVDDFDGKWPYRDLLRFTDRYKYQGQRKGGYLKINSDEIIFTCSFHPSHYYQEKELDQVLRRINRIIHLENSTKEFFKFADFVNQTKCTDVDGNTKTSTFSETLRLFDEWHECVYETVQV